MIGRLLDGLGIDPLQWRALVRTYIRMDLRRTGGPSKAGAAAAAMPYLAIAVMTGITSVVLALVTAAVRDEFTAAVVVTSFAAFNISVFLFADFTGLVVSPDDYRVLACRPVTSRTYFAARLSAVLAYVLALAAILGFLPSLAFWIWRDLGVTVFLIAFAAVLMCCASATVMVISIYTLLLKIVHPRRLVRALSYLQLVSMSIFLGAYYLVMTGFTSTGVHDLSVREHAWIWLNPASWFAAMVPVAAGTAGWTEWAGAAAALALMAVSIPLAAGRLSLQYAERLSEMTAAAEPPNRRPLGRMPGFRQGEALAVALLVRAQFRYDNRFRLAVLSMVPLTVFYSLIGLNDGALSDPFTADIGALATPLYFATTFLPMTLHSALLYSEGWRGAWIFFATPADPARLIIGAKNFVAVVFLGGYLLLLAVIWSFTYDRVWHAFVHAAIVGLMAHFLLQGAAIVKPALPFAIEPRKAVHGGMLFVLFFVGGIASGVLPLLLWVVYARPLRLAVFATVLVIITFGLEYVVRLRAREAVDELEFTG